MSKKYGSLATHKKKKKKKNYHIIALSLSLLFYFVSCLLNWCVFAHQLVSILLHSFVTCKTDCSRYSIVLYHMVLNSYYLSGSTRCEWKCLWLVVDIIYFCFWAISFFPVPAAFLLVFFFFGILSSLAGTFLDIQFFPSGCMPKGRVLCTALRTCKFDTRIVHYSCRERFIGSLVDRRPNPRLCNCISEGIK